MPIYLIFFDLKFCSIPLNYNFVRIYYCSWCSSEKDSLSILVTSIGKKVTWQKVTLPIQLLTNNLSNKTKLNDKFQMKIDKREEYDRIMRMPLVIIPKSWKP